MLYLIKSYGPRGKKIYKVGYTTSLENRLSSYFSHNPFIELISVREGNEELEKLIHVCLYSLGYKFTKGGKLDEWFIGDPEVLSIFHISRESLERKIWKHRDKVFSKDKIKSDKSSDFQLFRYLYFKNKDSFVGETYRVTEDKKLIKLNPREIDIVFYNSLLKYFPEDIDLNEVFPDIPIELEKEVQDFLDNKFYKTGIFRKKMKMYCEFMDKYGNNKYILNSIIHKIDPKFKTYYDLFGTSGFKAVRYEELLLKNKISDNIKSLNLKNELILHFKIQSKYTLKNIKTILSYIYTNLSITKTPKASELENYFDLKLILVQDSLSGKRSKGYLILGIK